MFLAAVVQMTSTSDPEANWLQARPLVERALYGARLVAKPKIIHFLGPPDPRPTGSEQAPVLVRIPRAHRAQPVPGPAAVSERAVSTRSAVGIFILTIPHSERISLDGSPTADHVRGMVRRIRSEVTEPGQVRHCSSVHLLRSGLAFGIGIWFPGVPRPRSGPPSSPPKPPQATGRWSSSGKASSSDTRG
jgi:hypothetical protein